MPARLNNLCGDRRMECTVVIPTYNRPNHLKRILSYYHQYGKDLPVLIADSSSEENKRLNRETVTSFNDSCFTYLDKYDPSANHVNKIFDALEHVNSKYCVLCADDDFVTPNGIRESTDFLDLNPGFTAAHGVQAAFTLKFAAGREPQFRCRQHLGPSHIQLKPEDRLIYKVADDDHTSFYAVHSTDLIKMVFTEILNMTCYMPFTGDLTYRSDLLFAELLIVWLPAIYGKEKCLDTLFSVREDCTPAHLRRSDITMRDFMKDKKYKENRQNFSDCVSLHLSEQSGISIAEAHEIVDKEVSVYIDKSISFGGRVVAAFNLPNWMDQAGRKLYRTIPRLFTRYYSIDALPSKYFNDYSQIRLQVLSNAREVYGINR